MKQTLKDNFEIADYIQSVSSGEVDREQIVATFWGARAELRRVSVASLEMNSEKNHAEDSVKQKNYNKMDVSEAPPILVDLEDNIIYDGHHRVRAAIYQEAESIMAYVIVWE